MYYFLLLLLFFSNSLMAKDEKFVQTRFFLLGNLKSTNQEQSWIPVQALFEFNRYFRLGLNYNAFNFREDSVLIYYNNTEKVSMTRAYALGVQSELHFYNFKYGSFYLAPFIMNRTGREKILYKVTENNYLCEKDLLIKAKHQYGGAKLGYEQKIYKYFSLNAAIPVSQSILSRKVDIYQNINTCQSDQLAEPLSNIDNLKFADFFPFFDLSLGIKF